MRKLLAIVSIVGLLSGEAWGEDLEPNVLKGHMEDPTAWQQVDDATIRELVNNGSVCRVIGHRWEMGCGVIGCLVYHPNPIRHCVICGKTETQEIVPWK